MTMLGLKQTLPYAVPNAGLYVGDDKLLIPGSLILHDMTHSQNPMPSGVPSSGSSIPNIAYGEAVALIGSGSQASMASTFNNSAQAADAVFERTAKGGLHGLYSQANNSNSNRGAYFSAAPAIVAYLYANLSHDYYFSAWTYRTRVAKTSSPPRMVNIAAQLNAGHFLVDFDAGGNYPATGKGSAISNGVNSLGLSRRSVESNSWATNPPVSLSDTLVYPMGWGNYGPGTSAWENLAAGDIFYRCYLEDLTVSGRTYATVDNLDAAQFALACQTSGGAYYGDSGWTSPSSFP